jgi:hypothetical protein
VLSDFDKTWLLDSAQYALIETHCACFFPTQNQKSLARSVSANGGSSPGDLLGTKRCAKKRVLHTKRAPLLGRSKLQTGLFEMDPQIGLTQFVLGLGSWVPVSYCGDFQS